MREEVAVLFGSKTVRALRRSLSGVALGVAVVVLSGCTAFVKDEPPPCPRVSVVEDASTLVRFAGGGHEAKDVRMHAEIVSYHGSCLYDRDDKTMAVTFSVGIDAFPGPDSAGGPQDVSYFVAIPAFFPSDNGKKIMPLTLDVPSDAKGTHVDDRPVKITFPVKNLKDMARYEIFVGFQLDPAELDYNRKHDHR